MLSCGCEPGGKLCEQHATQRDTRLVIQIARGIDALGVDGIDRMIEAITASPGQLGEICPDAAQLFEPRRLAAVDLFRAIRASAPACRRFLHVLVHTQRDCVRAERMLAGSLAVSEARQGTPDGHGDRPVDAARTGAAGREQPMAKKQCVRCMGPIEDGVCLSCGVADPTAASGSTDGGDAAEAM